MVVPYKIARLDTILDLSVFGLAHETRYGVKVAKPLQTKLAALADVWCEFLGRHSMWRLDVVVDEAGEPHVVEVNTHELHGGCAFDVYQIAVLGYNPWPWTHIDLLRELAASGYVYAYKDQIDCPIVGWYLPFIPFVSRTKIAQQLEGKVLLYDAALGITGKKLYWSRKQLQDNENKAALIDWCKRKNLRIAETLLAPVGARLRPGWIFKRMTGWGGKSIVTSVRANNIVQQRWIEPYKDQGFVVLSGLFANGAVWCKASQSSDGVVRSMSSGDAWVPVVDVYTK